MKRWRPAHTGLLCIANRRASSRSIDIGAAAAAAADLAQQVAADEQPAPDQEV
jgi:hypothetical protein